MSIWTARAAPSLGRNSDQGKPVPIISKVSQPFIRSELGLVPSRPIAPVTNGRSSGSTDFAEQRLGDAGAERSRRPAMTSSAASAAPAPIRIATFSPALSTSAALRRSASAGTIDAAANSRDPSA